MACDFLLTLLYVENKLKLNGSTKQS